MWPVVCITFESERIIKELSPALDPHASLCMAIPSTWIIPKILAHEFRLQGRALRLSTTATRCHSYYEGERTLHLPALHTQKGRAPQSRRAFL